MNQAIAIEAPLAAQLPALEPARREWATWLSRGISLALLIAVMIELADAGPTLLRTVLPASPWFWIGFAATYLAVPVADWVIFRKLWRLPLAGFPVLLRKRVSNELLLAYSGEVYFYLWARRRATLTNAPFGAIKDVNILSALAANVLTLVLLVAAWPFITQMAAGRYTDAAIASIALLLAISLGVMLFGRRVFSLPRPTLAWVGAIHMGRVLASTAMLGLIWHIALPEVPVGVWLALSTLRLVVSRLPLLPSKDLLFATIAIFLIGQDNQVTALLAMTAALMTAAHVLIGGGLLVSAFLQREANDA